MSKKRSGKPGATKSGATKSKSGKVTSPAEKRLALRLLGWTVAVVALSFAFAMLSLVGGVYGPWGAAVAIGLVSGALGLKPVPGAMLAVGSSSAGALWVALAFSAERLTRIGDAGLNAIAANSPNFFRSEWYASTVQLNASPGRVGVLLAAAVLSTAVAFSAGAWVRAARSSNRGRLVGWGSVGVIVGIAALGVFSSPSQTLDMPFVPGQYGWDMYIYDATVRGVQEGSPYYEAVVRAAAGDLRLIREGSVKDGQFVAWARSSSQLRMPYLFYAWAGLRSAGGGDAGVQWGLILLLAAACAGAYVSTVARVGPAAALIGVPVVAVTVPLLVNASIFAPELWAGLLAVIACFLWIWGQRLPAIGVAFLAALCRDVALLQLALFVVAALTDTVRWRLNRPAAASLAEMLGMDATSHAVRPGWWARPAIILTAGVLAIGLFAGAYVLHSAESAKIIAGAEGAGANITTMLQQSAARPFAEKAYWPASYSIPHLLLMGVPGLALAFLQLPGWWFGLDLRWGDAVATLGVGAAWLATLLTIGATSPHWGNLFVPLMAAGTGALFAGMFRYAMPAPAVR